MSQYNPVLCAGRVRTSQIAALAGWQLAIRSKGEGQFEIYL